ncbi:MAG: DUF4249 family protein [Candidatus Coatesbacteria bacterium]|nr:DUF4249 family protein [Candidatus Coatesbacteria bacterium]
MKKKKIFFVILLSFVLLNCFDEEYVPQLIVRGYFYPEQQITNIRLSESVDIGQKYDSLAVAISDAKIYITTKDNKFMLEESETRKGSYTSPIKPLPGETYNIEIFAKDFHATGQTLIPSQIQITKAPSDTISIEEPIPLEWSACDSCYGYMLTVICRDEIKIPIDSTFEEMRKENAEKDQIPFFIIKKEITSIEIPAFFFWYWGNQVIKIYAIDKSLWDYLRSYSDWASSKPNYHMKGALGVLAGISVDSVNVFLKKTR